MKKIILMAMIAAPIWAGAQTKASDKSESKGTKTETKEVPAPSDKGKEAPASKATVTSPESIFAEIIVTQNAAGGTVIRLDFGRETTTGIDDKELIEKMRVARELTFQTIPDAMTYMNNIGFKLLSSYNMSVNGKDEVHLILEKRMARKGGQKGEGGPERPGAGAKPSGDEKNPAPTPTKPNKK